MHQEPVLSRGYALWGDTLELRRYAPIEKED